MDPLRLLKDMLGHESVSTTEVYLDFADKRLLEREAQIRYLVEIGDLDPEEAA